MEILMKSRAKFAIKSLENLVDFSAFTIASSPG